MQSASVILTASMLQHFATLPNIVPQTALLGASGLASVMVRRPVRATREIEEALISAIERG